MREGFDITGYWKERGKTYVNETRLHSAFYREQALLIMETVHQVIGPNNTPCILELGCGYGRITSLLGCLYPRGEIVGVDVSEDQMRHASRLCREMRNLVFLNRDLCDGPWLKDISNYPWNIVVAVELFLHLRSETVMELVSMFLRNKSVVVHEHDWWCPGEHSDPGAGERSDPGEHVCYHPYTSMYEDAGFKVTTVKKYGQVALIVKGQ